MYINAWNMIPGIGAQKLFMIASQCGSFCDAWHFDRDDLARIGLSDNLINAIKIARTQIDPAQEWQILSHHDITLIPFGDPLYPKKLSIISSPPFCLYVRGDKDVLSSPSVAVVGSRKISEYGIRATVSLVTDIARSGITVVSGLALGTDALAHRTTFSHIACTFDPQ
jgi:DNA processing protein